MFKYGLRCKARYQIIIKFPTKLLIHKWIILVYNHGKDRIIERFQGWLLLLIYCQKILLNEVSLQLNIFY